MMAGMVIYAVILGVVIFCVAMAYVCHKDNMRRIANGTDERLVKYDQYGQTLGDTRQKRPLR